MSRQIAAYSESDLSVLRQNILNQIEKNHLQAGELFFKSTPLLALRKLRFDKAMTDPLFGGDMNFSEYLNQTFTYLVCLYAGEEILRRFSPDAVLINFGVQPGHDVTSLDGAIICECFAATSVKSNEKLKKDVLRVHRNKNARQKLVYFYSDSAMAEKTYIQHLSEQYPDVSIRSISLKQLIGV